MWEFADDGSGFYRQLATRKGDILSELVELNGELLVFDEERA